jgi:alpha-glucoside transport system permease protein
MTTTPSVPQAPPDKDVRKGKVKASEESALGGASLFVKIALVVICVLWMVPVIGLLISSVRPADVISTSGWWTVFTNPFGQEWTLENYRAVLTGQGMGQSFINSLVISIPATVIPITAAAFAAYAFSWMRFPGRDFLFIFVVALLVVPLYVAFVPLIRIYTGWGIQGEYLAAWLAHTGFGMPLAVYLLRNYMGSLPREVIESAKVDGATHFQTFWRLMIPLSMPALAAFAIFQFLWVWNDLLVALIFLGTLPDVQAVTVNLQNLIGSRGQDWHLLTSAAFITMTVPLIVFFSLQRYFVRGLTAGSVKG